MNMVPLWMSGYISGKLIDAWYNAIYIVFMRNAAQFYSYFDFHFDNKIGG